MFSTPRNNTSAALHAFARTTGKVLPALFFVVTAALLLRYILLYGAEEKRSAWDRPIYGDAGGYYVYLPAQFIYDFNGTKLTPQTWFEFGQGYSVNEGRIATKYTYGVAALQAPFFAAVHLCIKASGGKADGVSPGYNYVMLLAAAFYLLLGLWFLYRFLKFYFSGSLSVLILMLVVAATNLWHYSTVMAGMSHVYSFFLISLLLFQFRSYLTDRKFYRIVIAALAFGFIVLIRPTNALVGISLLFLDTKNSSDVWQRIRLFLQPRVLACFILLPVLIFLPQLQYWHFLTGSYVHWSYGNERFDNWLHPDFAGAWFAPRGGMIPFVPLMAVVFIAMIVSVVRRNANSRWLFALFLLQSYLYASWDNVSFGQCGFGNRNYIDWLPVLALPLGQLLLLLYRSRFVFFAGGMLVLSLVVVMHFKLHNRFDTCFHGDGDWDWKEYKYLLFAESYNATEGYEHNDLQLPYAHAYAGKYVGLLTTNGHINTSGFHFRQGDQTHSHFRSLRFETQVLLPHATKAKLFCRVWMMTPNGDPVYWAEEPLTLPASTGEWKKASLFCALPPWTSPDCMIHAMLHTESSDSIFVDNSRIELR